MSHIAVDLKVIETHAPNIARAAGVTLDRVLAGLVLLWHRCWSTKRDTLSLAEIAGCFGRERLEELISALTIDFLEKQADGSFRVRGADQYLRLRAARAKGAAITNAKRRVSDAQAEVSDAPATLISTQQPNERPSSDAPATLKHALTPSTEHRAPNTTDAVGAPPIAAFEIEQPDTDNIENWTKEDFWKAAELVRRELGLPPEKWPNRWKLNAWWSEARALCDVTELAAAFERFCRDKYALERAPPAPFGLFMTNWNNHLPRKSA